MTARALVIVFCAWFSSGALAAVEVPDDQDELAQVSAELARVQERRLESEQIQQEVAWSLSNTLERLQVGGFSQALGDIFLSERRRLQPVLNLRFELRDTRAMLVETRLRDIDLRETRHYLAPGDPMLPELRRLSEAYGQLEVALQQQETRLLAILEDAETLDRLLAQNLLWWPSHKRAGWKWFAGLPSASVEFIRPANWRRAGGALYDASVGRPLSFGLTLIVALALWWIGRRAPAKLAASADYVGRPYSDRFAFSASALGWSLVGVAAIPVALFLTARALAGLPEQDITLEGLAAAFRISAAWLFAGYFLRLLLHPAGLGPKHFQWRADRCALWRRQLGWFIPVQWGLIVVLVLSYHHGDAGAFDHVGRLAMLGILLSLALLSMAAMRSGANAQAQRPRRTLVLAGLWWLLLAGLAILALTGYLHTINTFLINGFRTVLLVGGVSLAYFMLMRAALLVERRLEMDRKHQRVLTEEIADAGTEGAVIDTLETDISLEHVDAQVRMLARILVFAVLVVGLYLIWHDILPALAMLDDISLWMRSGGDAEIPGSVSLRDVLMAVLVAATVLLGMRNLAGTMEVLLFKRTGMDASMRYTITALTRYVVAVASVIVISNFLGLRWSELQWLIAALTVGLGFGLQEIVGNLVSGVIVLFERPVRVGDTITIGEYSGKVTRIRTRATTIIDWDNREIVVPNKAFITEKLINWTLSDSITRIVIKLGISYDADTEQARETLLEIVRNHPAVMDEPAPAVLFTGFGDSALEFEMRAYVHELRERLITVSELNTAIIRTFREKGIEIAYPQLDLHVRTSPN